MRFTLLAAYLLLTAAPALANAEPPAQTGKICEERIRNAGLDFGEKAQIRDWPHGCLIANGGIAFGTYQNWIFKRAEFKSDSIAALAKDMQAIPLWSSLSIEGLALQIPTSSASARYIAALQQWPMDFSGSYRWYPDEGRLEVDDMQLSSPRSGLLGVSGDFVAEKNATPQSLAALNTLGVSRLRLRIDNQGLFEAIVGPSAVALLTAGNADDADVEAQVEASKTQAVAVLAAIPDDQIDKNSRQSLIRFVQDMPHPVGSFSVEIEFPKPLMFGELMQSGDPVGVLKLLSSAKFTAYYTAR